MPEIPTRKQQPKPVPPQVPLPSDFPPIPQEILARFPSAANWQQRLNDFWKRTNQAVQQVQQETSAQVNSTVIWTVDRFLIYTNNGGSIPMFALDDTGIRLGNVLVINTPGRKVYIGAGNYQDADTPFYIDTDGKFSLGANLTWDPDTATLTITGIINATSGTIGGFSIGSDYIRDTANSFGLASTVTGGDDVRFWAGATFANRATAPLKITDGGILTAQGLYASNAAGTLRYLVFQTSGVDRWALTAYSDPETGANAGSKWLLQSFADDGSYITDNLQIARDTGNWLLGPERYVSMRWNGVGVTSQIKLDLNNDTAATAILNQWSPAQHFKGDGWHTTGAARLNCHWKVEIKPTTGTTAPYNPLVYSSDVSDTPTYAERVIFDSIGLQAAIVAIPAGGTSGTGFRFSSTANFGVFFGSGAPTLVAAKGSIYLRSDGSATNDRAYIATDSAGAWTNLTTAT